MKTTDKSVQVMSGNEVTKKQMKHSTNATKYRDLGALKGEFIYMLVHAFRVRIKAEKKGVVEILRSIQNNRNGLSSSAYRRI